VQHAIGDLALLADGRTAALVDPDGNVAWMCWPRFDSTPVLMQILDTRRGGVFALRPVAPEARVLARRYVPATLVLETTWQVGRSRLLVEDALLLDGSGRLVRRMRSEGDAVEVEVRFQLSPEAPPDAGLEVTSASPWADDAGVRVSRFEVASTPSVVTLHATRMHPAPVSAVDDTLRRWRGLCPAPRSFRLSSLSTPAMGEGELRDLLATSACVLLGLRASGGGIVAAPTTSLPQWPQTSRTWDYRYCWLRDAALAATALLRLGLVDDARSLALFLAGIAARDEPPALVRVDGTPAPEERSLDHLEGYRGARPVRIGNAAAKQLQIDITGEFTQLARALNDVDGLPDELAQGCGRMVEWAAACWTEPDHGIWEIRGAPRHYTHSRVMAWRALRDGARLAEEGMIEGDAARWRRLADEIRATVMRGDGELQLTDTGGGPDAALACLPLVGFLSADHPRCRSTLEAITHTLGRAGLLDRCLPEQETSREPCGPFLFPTFWMASALERSGSSGGRHIEAALAARSSLGLFGEVADPRGSTPLGNYPQVQSHAAFVLAATEA
jgi:alpha,alpha-trehalase